MTELVQQHGSGHQPSFSIEWQIGIVRIGILSPTSKYHTFDGSAHNYACAEAVGPIYIKRLPDTIRDKDSSVLSYEQLLLAHK